MYTSRSVEEKHQVVTEGVTCVIHVATIHFEMCARVGCFIT